jgi:drug/metabolite transporter (DMT)-like permease
MLLTATLLYTRPQEFRLVPQYWPRMTLIGAAGFSASLCWFWSYSLTLVAYAKAVGQVEALLAIGIALIVWRKREVIRQLPGVALIVVGIALVLLG